MFKSKRSKIVAIVVLVIVGGLYVSGLWAVILMLITPIGPGLPPPESMQVWYLPSPDYPDYVSGENGSVVVVNEPFVEYFSLIGERKKGSSSPFFPALSLYCGYANYSRTESTDRYLAGEWYFGDKKQLQQAESELYRYLEEHGRVSTVELNISRELRYAPRNAPKSFDATKYESEMTSGYFMVYDKPFVSYRADYFIVYYGSIGSVDISNQTPFLKVLIADGYYINDPAWGTVRSLKEAGDISH